jgi:DNA-directed RNA polymerase subunit RPC12/RpoP
VISKVYISHCENDESSAIEISNSLSRIGLECFLMMYINSPGLTHANKVSYGIRNSECLVALISRDGQNSAIVGQEIGLAKGIDLLIIPLLERGAVLPFLLENLKPIGFTTERLEDAIGVLIRTFRELSKLEWLKIKCPSCNEEMTQYLTLQEEVDHALENRSYLETICTYCQSKILLDPRTFIPMQ